MNINRRLTHRMTGGFSYTRQQESWNPIATVYMPATWTYAAWTRWIALRFGAWVWVGSRQVEVER